MTESNLAWLDVSLRSCHAGSNKNVIRKSVAFAEAKKGEFSLHNFFFFFFFYFFLLPSSDHNKYPSLWLANSHKTLLWNFFFMPLVFTFFLDAGFWNVFIKTGSVFFPQHKVLYLCHKSWFFLFPFLCFYSFISWTHTHN